MFVNSYSAANVKAWIICLKDFQTSHHKSEILKSQRVVKPLTVNVLQNTGMSIT